MTAEQPTAATALRRSRLRGAFRTLWPAAAGLSIAVPTVVYLHRDDAGWPAGLIVGFMLAVIARTVQDGVDGATSRAADREAARLVADGRITRGPAGRRGQDFWWVDSVTRVPPRADLTAALDSLWEGAVVAVADVALLGDPVTGRRSAVTRGARWTQEAASSVTPV